MDFKTTHPTNGDIETNTPTRPGTETSPPPGTTESTNPSSRPPKQVTLKLIKPKKGKITKKTKAIIIKVTKSAKATLSAKGLKAKTKIKNVKMRKMKYTFKKLNFQKVRKGAWIKITAKKSKMKPKTIKFKRK